MFRLLQLLFPPSGWMRAIILLFNGARVHPSAVLLGKKKQIICEDGVKVGSGSRIDPGFDGQVMFGAGVWISTGVEMQTESRIAIGRGTTIQRRTSINGSVVIGRGCIIAPNVFISSGTHPFREIPHLPIREQEKRLSKTDQNLVSIDRKIWIQDDCWLGTNAVISPGITVGKGSVVGANSVVTKDAPPYSVVAGCPAKVLQKRLDWKPKARIEVSSEQDHPYIIDANLVRNAKGWVASLSCTEGLLAALSAPSGLYSVYFEWASSVPFLWVIGNREIHQEPSSGILIIPSKNFPEIDKIVYCNLEIKNINRTVAIVEISKIYLDK